MNDPWYRQGPWDGLCGFYAALNALCGLFPDLHKANRKERREMFDEAVEQLTRTAGVTTRILQGDSDKGGIDQYQIAEFVSRTARLWRKRADVELLHELELSRTLDQFLAYEGTVGRFSLVCGRSAGGHWATVIRKPQGELFLVDPSGVDDDGPVGGRTGFRPDHREGIIIRAGAE